MLIETIRVAFRHSALSDMVLFLGALWQAILVACHMRPASIPVETDGDKIRGLREELDRVERLMMEVDEAAENEGFATASFPEHALCRYGSNQHCQALDDPIVGTIQELQAKRALLKMAKELEARLGIT